MTDKWNFDMTQAPRGEYREVTRIVGRHKAESTRLEHVPVTIIAAGNDGVVTLSRWLPDAKRWNMFSASVPPMAWMPLPDHPEHQNEEYDNA